MKKYVTANTNNIYKRYMIEYKQHGQGFKIIRVFANDEQEIKKLYNKYKEFGGYGFHVFEIKHLGFLDDNGDIISE